MVTFPDLKHNIDAARKAQALGATDVLWRPEAPRRSYGYAPDAPNPPVAVYFFKGGVEVGYTIAGQPFLVEVSRPRHPRDLANLKKVSIGTYIAVEGKVW